MTSPKEAAMYLAKEADIPVNGHKPEYRLTIHDAGDIEAREVTWLWPRRLPVGKVCLLAGDPGLGKSYLTLDLAARVSLGGPWPDEGEAPKGNVLLISCEDGMADTIRPRLDLLGANLANIQLIEPTVASATETISLSLVDHLTLLEKAVVDSDATLMILDPILAFTGAKDTHRSSDVRAVLAPLAGMAEQTGCTILAIIHLNKKSGEFNSVYRLTGSLDFAAAARSVMVVGKHPELDGHRILAPVKMNLSSMPQSLEYSFTEDGIFAWGGVSTLEANDILVTPDPAAKGARLQAREALEELLQGGPVMSNAVWEDMDKDGHSRETVKRAAADLGVFKYQLKSKTGKKGSPGWVWSLTPGDLE